VDKVLTVGQGQRLGNQAVLVAVVLVKQALKVMLGTVEMASVLPLTALQRSELVAEGAVQKVQAVQADWEEVLLV